MIIPDISQYIRDKEDSFTEKDFDVVMHELQRRAVCKYRFIHDTCDKPAFYINHKIEPSEYVLDHITNLDGTVPEEGGPVVCGSCGQRVENYIVGEKWTEDD